MTDEAEPPTEGPQVSHPPLRTVAAYTLTGALLAVLVLGLGGWSPTAGLGLVASGLLGLGVYRRDATSVWLGLVGLAISSAAVRFAGPASAVVFMLVGGTLFVLLTTALAETGEASPIRPDLETRDHQVRWAGLAGLWLAVVVTPLLVPATRLVMASEIAITVTVLLVTGANVLVFVLPLAALGDERREVDADELPDTRGFVVRGSRRPGDSHG